MLLVMRYADLYEQPVVWTGNIPCFIVILVIVSLHAAYFFVSFCIYVYCICIHLYARSRRFYLKYFCLSRIYDFFFILSIAKFSRCKITELIFDKKVTPYNVCFWSFNIRIEACILYILYARKITYFYVNDKSLEFINCISKEFF